MHPRKREQETGERSASLTGWTPVLAAVGILVTGALSTVLALQLDSLHPSVGDVVVYQPGSQDPDAWEIQVPATHVVSSSVANGTCTLDPNVMAVGGGSLVVESRQLTGDPLYRLHWAGKHTAKGAADCGNSAELTVTRIDLQKLANAAGGFGVENKTQVQ